MPGPPDGWRDGRQLLVTETREDPRVEGVAVGLDGARRQCAALDRALSEPGIGVGPQGDVGRGGFEPLTLSQLGLDAGEPASGVALGNPVSGEEWRWPSGA